MHSCHSQKSTAANVVATIPREVKSNPKTPAARQLLAMMVVAEDAPLYELALQLVEQCLSFFQIGRVEAFAEPAVDRGEHRARLFAIALL
jgi:hypothetical protein